MRVELLKIWQETKKTVFFVTHNPLQSAFLADRIYLFSRRPTRVVREVEVPFTRPRDADDPSMSAVTKTIIVLDS
jgi:ABC-type nitrate/sulfonate/bicarbonate transport system ATPase subunit